MLSVPDGFGRFPDEVPAAQVPEEGMPAHIHGEISEPVSCTQMTHVLFLIGKFPRPACTHVWMVGTRKSYVNVE